MSVDELSIKNDRKGAIFAGENLFFRGFPISVELTEDYAEQFLAETIVSDYDIFECLEGTILRVFFFGDKFHVSTSKRLDAFKSKWASTRTSFGQSFVHQLRKLVDLKEDDDQEYLQKFCQKYLDRSKRYLFMLRSSEEERIVCDANLIPGVTHLCNETDSHAMDFDQVIELDDDTRFPKSKRIKGLTSGKMVADFVRESTHFRISQGIIMFKQTDEELVSIKILSREYYDRFRLRNNVASLKFRYLELRKAPWDLDLFFEMYPEMKQKSEEIEENIWKVCERLHELYVNTHIRNISATSTKEERSALNVIHKEYLMTRERTTASKINDILTKEPATRLNKLLRERHVMEK